MGGDLQVAAEHESQTSGDDSERERRLESAARAILAGILFVKKWRGSVLTVVRNSERICQLTPFPAGYSSMR
jgi:hypothetical protein